ncbi:DUF2207 domain-containing protein [Frigoriflavimonas asaccharolytica]|uniref:Putative membrane protein YgcG n=1 Tax=Frigoriflavimonas asaccharolytica TaxID=2735899 RepID=A0A8J8GBR7_9FLAO|nr:DUF2207 domain-containing protein [Frigoriflavimonas asaccharolytica]NRS92782.1 putative membrane protein YgcG [Frigoriflavimonas asaccharolytica]
MKTFFFTLFLLVFSFGAAQDTDAAPELINYEHILSFHSDISIDKNAQVSIIEKIKVYASGNIIKRGIFRSLPKYRNINGKEEKIKYNIISVKRDGEEEEYHTESSTSDFQIYVGDKDIFLDPGLYEYEITYKSSNQIGFFSGYDEFYWNVNGNLWDFAVDEISAKVVFPDNAKILQNSCYTGSYGSSESNCTVNKISDSSIEWSAKNLQPNEGLTIAVGFAKGLFAPPPPPTDIEKYGVLFAMILTGLGLLFHFYFQWQKCGVDPEKPTIYPQFNAPQNLSPASIGYLQQGYYSGNMISAAIVSLATQGFLKIIEDDKRILGIFGGREYSLEKQKEQDQTLSKEEINLMNNLFSNGKKRVTFDGKFDEDIKNAVDDFKVTLSFQHDKFLNKGNNSSKLILPALIIVGAYIIGLFLSFNFTDNDALLGIGVGLGIAVLILTILFSVSYERYLSARILFWIISTIMILFIVFISAKNDRSLQNIGFYASYAFIVLGFISFVLFQYLIKLPSIEKLETLSLIEGFKMYLGTAEEKTLQFHNSPKMTPQIFEKMLPFAMVLGVDKIWGEKFQNMIKNSAIGQENYQTNWFVGNSVMNMNFGNTLNSSLSQSIASSATQPSSSGSGSGGGGFSGGGGGGGGGGGW